jgi:hypothetical protein
MAWMALTPRGAWRGNSRSFGSAAKIRVVVLAAALAVGALALMATQASAHPGNGNGNSNGHAYAGTCPPASHNPGGGTPCGFPHDISEPTPTPTAATPNPVSEVAGAVHTRHEKVESPAAPHGTVIVPPRQTTKAPVVKHAAKKKYRHPVGPGIRGRSAPFVAAPAPAGNSDRSTFADRLLSPTQIDLSAENLGKGGVLAFLLAALLYLPITIFNKATEKNHDVIQQWLGRPRAWLAAIAAVIPFQGHTLLTLAAGVLASTALFSFVEPGFPHENGSLEYAIGMLIGFAVVSAVFFGTWRFVIHWLEPHSTGRWRIYPPYILLAACFVILSRAAHLLPGVVIGTVAEYEPSRKLNRRTAGIRVANTYGALLIMGMIAWFAWIPVEHAASHEGASSLTLILDSALAIIFVSSLESVAFGLIPMRFLDGNDLYVWRKPLWAAMWGTSLLWFSIVILHPALSTYSHLTQTKAIALALLFGGLMFAALATWGYFRWRDARLARAAEV